jgi:hypothetical protein
MLRPISSILLAGFVALAACGDDNDGGDAALVSAFPDSGFVGRTTTLILVGDNTNFSAASNIDFGPGVTVSNVMVAGANALIVDATVAVDAELGDRTVTVDNLALPGAFTLENPVQVEVLGTPAQGSFSVIRMTNLDRANPFDLTTDEEGNFTNLEATVSGTGASVTIGTASAFEIELTLQVDVTAPPGAATVEVNSATLPSRAPVEITARTAMPITPGTPVTGSVANGFESVLYEVNIADLSAISVSVPDTESGGAFIQILGSTGSFDEPIGASFNSIFGPAEFSNNIPGGGKIYLILWEGFDAAGYDYTFNVGQIAAATTITHTEPNNTRQTAQVVTGGSGVLGGTFVDAADEDFYSINLVAADVGKTLTVSSGGFGGADPVIEIFRGNTSIAGPEDAAFFDRLSVDIAQAGQHFIRITSSDFGPTNPADSDYTLVIGLE